MDQAFSREDNEWLRTQLNQEFYKIRPSWVEAGRWAMPWRIKWMLNEEEGKRNNQHIVDPTHRVALRSYVAGFCEGNTSSTRPWFRYAHPDPEVNKYEENKFWLDSLVSRATQIATSSNLYNILPGGYADFGVFNTFAIWVDEFVKGPHFTLLQPGSYRVMNDSRGIPSILLREFSIPIRTLVKQFGKKKNGKWDWSNFSPLVKDLYERGDYTTKVNICSITRENEFFNPNKPIAMSNRRWLTLTYETFVADGSDAPTQMYQNAYQSRDNFKNDQEEDTYLEITYHKRKPFFVPRSDSNGLFAYGENGPTFDALGLIKSLNKKAIGKDMALEKMLQPAIQGPASLRKSYITTAPNSYVPLDASSLNQGGLKSIYEINPAIAAIIQDVGDLRQIVSKIYYEDFLLFLTQNPKTRTKAETDAIVSEQQLVIGPNLNSLNYTLNRPLAEWLAEWTIFEDPYLPPPPPGLQGMSLDPVFISPFAQAQRAADLPSIDRYLTFLQVASQMDPSVLQKGNLDRIADLYEDRLYLPAGVNREQGKVDALREKQAMDMQRQQALTETLPAISQSVKNLKTAQ